MLLIMADPHASPNDPGPPEKAPLRLGHFTDSDMRLLVITFVGTLAGTLATVLVTALALAMSRAIAATPQAWLRPPWILSAVVLWFLVSYFGWSYWPRRRDQASVVPVVVVVLFPFLIFIFLTLVALSTAITKLCFGHCIGTAVTIPIKLIPCYQAIYNLALRINWTRRPVAAQ
jgi:hypothetical protein